MQRNRALTPLFGNGAGAFRIGKNSVILTKIGKNQNILCMKLLMSNQHSLHGIIIFSEESSQLGDITGCESL